MLSIKKQSNITLIKVILDNGSKISLWPLFKWLEAKVNVMLITIKYFTSTKWIFKKFISLVNKLISVSGV